MLESEDYDGEGLSEANMSYIKLVLKNKVQLEKKFAEFENLI